MKVLVTSLTFLIFCQLSACDFLREEVFFQEIEGHWIGDGQLIDADGVVIPISEDWKGEYLSDGSFEMKGMRLWDQEQQEFYWRFSHNESLDLIECEYWHTDVETPIRFEVSLTEERVEMKAPFGEPGGELIVSNQLEDGEILGSVALVRPDGSEILSGRVTHREAESE